MSNSFTVRLIELKVESTSYKFTARGKLKIKDEYKQPVEEATQHSLPDHLTFDQQCKMT